MILFYILLTFSFALSLSQSELKMAREGETITLNYHLTGAQTEDLLWTYGSGSSRTMIANVYRGVVKTDLIKRFSDRLQLDSQTASLTVSNLKTDDSGIYQLHNASDLEVLQKCSLIVYTPVPEPVIRIIRNVTQNHTVSQSCSVLCSVENGRDVTLSWQKEGETLSNTSSPDLSTPLSLPLEMEEDSSKYSCVAANPVSSWCVQLKLCLRETQKDGTWILWGIFIPGGILACLVVGVCFRKRVCRKSVGL